MNIWLVMLLGGLLTFGTRLSFIFLFSHSNVPEWLRRALRFVPPSVLSAIILPEILIVNNKIDFSLNNVRLLAGLVAILVAWRSRNALVTILVGMLALFVLQWLLPK